MVGNKFLLSISTRFKVFCYNNPYKPRLLDSEFCPTSNTGKGLEEMVASSPAWRSTVLQTLKMLEFKVGTHNTPSSTDLCSAGRFFYTQ
jgi:hypothetical protein